MNLPENITPLIDGDWMLYMACNAVEYSWSERWAEEQGADFDPDEPPPTPPFEEIVDVLEHKLKEIRDALNTKAVPIFFFTGHNNFRKTVAKTKAYKGNRDSEKPYHYQNLTNLIEARYPFQRKDDVEADDLMAIYQTQMLYSESVGGIFSPTCIVTVDKDLRQVNGWHYSPEGHNFPSFGPTYVTDDNSYIEYKDSEKPAKGLLGTGWKFFYAQLITGDTVDNIPGLPRQGPAKALSLLTPCTTPREAYEVVRDAYRDICIMADDYLLEQAYLLWMVRGYNEDGTPAMWEAPCDT